MSIEVIKTQIERFLASDVPEVLAIKGAWGIGKTYSWKKYLEEGKTQKKISLEKYLYVSLFGINSLDALKQAIFECVVSRELIGTEPSIETFKANFTAVSSSFGRKALDTFANLPVVRNFTSTIDSLSFLSLSKTLICIDDLERRGSKLEIKDVLGLVSQLKEQKKCKIVLLLNDGEDGLDDYLKFREKIVDIELKFAPSASECAAIAFDTQSDVHVTLRELSEKLDIRNIRILKKIERLVNLALPFSNDYEKEIKHQFIHSLTLFTWCYFNSNKEAPTLDFVTNLGYSFYGIGEDKDESDEHKKWKALLEKYDYQLTDELDLVLAEAVRTGYFIEDNLKLAATNKNEQVLAEKSDNSFSEAWNLFHDTFANNQEDVIEAIYKSFKSNAKNITPNNLNGTVNLFRELGEQEKASELIDYYIKLRSEEIDLFDPEKENFFGDTIDKEVLKKFEVAFSKLIKTESAKQVLERLAGKNGWNQKDEVILANTSVDEYYHLFKSETGRHLSSYVRACLQFGQFANPSEQHIIIASRAREALLRIAAESGINRRRVKKYGISLRT
ncbi:MAG: hypothetical protein WBL28_10990 [Methylotenera sp.]